MSQNTKVLTGCNLSRTPDSPLKNLNADNHLEAEIGARR